MHTHRTVAAMVAMVLGISWFAHAAEDRRQDAAILAAARNATVMLQFGTGVASAVVLDAERGLLATSKARFEGAGPIEAFLIRERRDAAGRISTTRIALGAVKAVVLHKDLDAAVLTVASNPELTGIGGQEGQPAEGSTAWIVGLPGGVRAEDIRDVEVRRGELSRRSARRTQRLCFGGPVHLSNVGGPVVDERARFVGVAGSAHSRGAPSPVIARAELFELADRPETHGLPADSTAAYLAPRAGPPRFLPVSSRPGGPPGRRVDFGSGVTAVKEARAVLATGMFILDRHDALEYSVCPKVNGKLHETIIATDADPAVINLALIALRYKSGGGVERLGDPSLPFGDRLGMYVEWDWNEAEAIRAWLRTIHPPWQRPNYAGVMERKSERVITWEPGPIIRMRLEELAFSHADAQPMVHTDWVYTGSTFGRDEETGKRYYRASVDGVLAAVYRDPVAVFNTALKTGEDDTSYFVRDTVVPPRGTSCLLIMLPAPDPNAAPE